MSSSTYIRKCWNCFPLSTVEPEIGRDIRTLPTAALHLVPFRQLHEYFLIESGPFEVSGLSAEGAVGGLVGDVFEALPTDGVLIAADEDRQTYYPIVFIRANGAFLGYSQKATPFHFLFCHYIDINYYREEAHPFSYFKKYHVDCHNKSSLF